MNSYLLAVKSGFGFLSTIPFGLTMEGLDELVKRIYLFPFVGIVIGLIIGTFAYLFGFVFPPVISAVAIIITVYYFTGFNHLDGLADFGDGLTAHGSREKKINAMKDVSLGIGGAAFCVLGLVSLYAVITTLLDESLVQNINLSTSLLIFSSLVVAEISAKQSMLTIAAFGKSIHEGLGSMVIDNTTFPKFIIGLAGGGFFCWLVLGIFGIVGFIAAMISALIILNITNRHFGGVTGDGLGTSNEVGRIITLLAVFLMIKGGYTGGVMIWTLL
ncbi:cobalamin 5'-phosphate synthase [Methanohalobium evestigatum Z-7303]|uniref:Adenosylcobinamide-GDP ribazoletransferase n=1 Tax=Methanohalobium evestigatum (strain ATCC BAA-1072 / DSM 3721 / NBRC 107634 / OCM 161 / Z-7303) TaxID=644295 RepID=D7E6A8_METEZ|nr:adenosylcobinamide-GDP ribazoletransferase [Methanohalobium evestigatum]ADI73130.1 cobalamin 5'-phosphate synthase [Methanohalobium evestigatum Z-7303]